MSQHLCHRTGRDLRTFNPRLEALEDRFQPSIYFDYSVIPSSNGDGRWALLITGTDYADTIRISDSGANGRGGVVVSGSNGFDRVSLGEGSDNIGEICVST